MEPDPRYREMAARIGLGQSPRIAALFAMLADSDEADLLLALPADVPGAARKLGREPAEVQKMVDELFLKGLVFPSRKTDPPPWRMSRDLVQFHDATILWPQAPPEFLDLWREFMDQEWYAIAKTIGAQVKKPFTRVIPVGVAIEARTSILDFDSVAKMIEKARSLAVTKCTCRLSMRNCDRPLEVCLQVDGAADYNLARGTGRAISREEALDILRRSEEAGLVHVTLNRHEGNNFICNCCPCCCQTMPVLIEGGIRVVDPSRFVAVVEAEECTACGACLERCYFSAISLGEQEGAPAMVDPERCMGCGLCLITCPTEALSLGEARSPAFVPGAA
ncbi:MAG: 4Fe-4S dicluster domain-containing protein [Proteobacteria bacterium]|nr:4Fe-4S dicluster domain-containing protein [Pseudomonadota bacterium]MBU4385167.1 4Fe-4S dicluster domain-containing protein [Pseudomonadota bacterium]MBU4603428.1 4Fe-4S dicluster domain-containing protein [Pseudomonadota bacterium]MCG2764774.1 4Fe-4S dicluster domain-containing protein [Desulfarculaceae bacterium]